jgi:hypothetical protein
MRKGMWAGLVALPLAVLGGLVYANSQRETTQPEEAAAFVCPVTGEELPCPLCCPLSNGK